MNKVLFSSSKHDWRTPSKLFSFLDSIHHFDLDPCASAENALCSHYFTVDDDGLSQPWSGRVFCNPPYGKQIPKWVQKCVDERNNCEVIVLLIPSRTDTSYFHDLIMKYAKNVVFIRGRLHFNDSKNPAPFPSLLAIF